jgi:type IV secretion system protein VirB6
MFTLGFVFIMHLILGLVQGWMLPWVSATALIYNWIETQISDFMGAVVKNTTDWATALAMMLVTLWILIQGYRMITGQSRDSMMALVVNMIKVAVIVTATSTMSFMGNDLRTWFTTDLSRGINQLVTGSDSDPSKDIDQNLAYTQLALGAIDGMQTSDPFDIQDKGRTALIATLGIAGPPMTAGALLLMYQIALALFVGLGPLFILCLIFEQTKPLFHKWLMYGIATLFSLAVLNFVVSLVLGLTLRVAAALWAASVINNIVGQSAEGFSNQALEQGGLGLLMTVLIISTPPMAAAFFNATIGAFNPYPLVAGGTQPQAASGTYMPTAGGHTQQPVNQTVPQSQAQVPPLRYPVTQPVQPDEIKPASQQE